MCGIAGLFKFENFNKKEDIKDITELLLLNIQERGVEASGIALINTNTNDIKIFKKPLKACDFIKEKKFNNLFKNIEKYNLILLHTRFSTNGKPNINKNNHPFYNEDFKNVLVHNGVIWNYEEIKEDKELNLDLKSDCDSEVILSLFNKKKGDLKATLNLLRGSFAVALYNNHKLYLYKDGNPIFLCYNKSRELFLFSSHENIFNSMFNRQKKNIYYGLFNINENEDDNITKEKFNILEFESEDFIKVDFKNKSFTKSKAITKPYTYINTTPINNLTIIKKREENTEKPLINGIDILSNNEKNNLRKKFLTPKELKQVKEFVSYYDSYNDEYFKDLENEENEFNKIYCFNRKDKNKNMRIHEKPLSADLSGIV